MPGNENDINYNRIWIGKLDRQVADERCFESWACRLHKAQEEHRSVEVEKVNLEQKLRDEINAAKQEAQRLRELREGTENELSRQKYAEEELEQVRMALKKAEKELESRGSWSPPETLQKWLQLTHEVEVQYYNIKKQGAERQLNIAKEGAEKIKKKRNTLFGTFHVAHSSSLDDVDHKILSAKQNPCKIPLVPADTVRLPKTCQCFSVEHLLGLIEISCLVLHIVLGFLCCSVWLMHFHLSSHRDLNRSDSESSISQSSDQQRLPNSSGSPSALLHNRSIPSKPTSLLKLTEEITPTLGVASDSNAPSPNGSSSSKQAESLSSMCSENISDSPLASRKAYTNRGLEKSASLGEIHQGAEGSALSPSESSRSLSPTSTDPESTGTDAKNGIKGTKIPQLASKKSPVEEDSTSTGEETEPNPGKKKPGFKLFKKKNK
ncbi:stromal interaction molecule 1-like [Scyliorhinus canicula]|uniref:stromal interaction molecule 1-like n=1 Tax=Scyliorhinus canicula TaxID=7830 RepID=UPI0018F67380|nr:stromal interaction molecule 1-like [Scyliorhinus canicula]